MSRVPEEYAKKQAARCIPATEAGQPILPLPNEGAAGQGKYSVLHFSPQQRPLDYIDQLPDDEDQGDQWRSGVRNLQYEDKQEDEEDWQDGEGV